MENKEERFKTAVLGYSKEEVDKKINELESKITLLISKLQEIKAENEKKSMIFKEEFKKMEDNKKKIADAYLVAQKNAENIIEQARSEINVERHIFEVENENLKEMIVQRKEAIRNVRLSVQSFSNELQVYFDKIVKNLSGDIETAVKELDFKYLEKIAPELDAPNIDSITNTAEIPEELLMYKDFNIDFNKDFKDFNNV